MKVETADSLKRSTHRAGHVKDKSRSPLRGCLRPNGKIWLKPHVGIGKLLPQVGEWGFEWGLRGGGAQNIPLLDIYLISPSSLLTRLENRAGHLTGNIWLQSTLKEQWDNSFQLIWWHTLDFILFRKRQSIACASNCLRISNIFTRSKSSQGIIFVNLNVWKILTVSPGVGNAPWGAFQMKTETKISTHSVGDRLWCIFIKYQISSNSTFDQIWTNSSPKCTWEHSPVLFLSFLRW